MVGVIGDRPGEDVHRHVEENGAGTATGGRPEGAFEEARQVLDTVHVPHAFAERSEDGALLRVGVRVDLLVGMPAVVVRRDVAGDDDQWNRVGGGSRHSGRRVGKPGPDVKERTPGHAAHPCVAVRGVCCDLLMPCSQEGDRALERVQNSDVGMAAEPEDVLDSVLLEPLDERGGSRPYLCDDHRLAPSRRSWNRSRHDHNEKSRKTSVFTVEKSSISQRGDSRPMPESLTPPNGMWSSR